MSDPNAVYEYCPVCRETVVAIPDRRSDVTFWTCIACGHVCDWAFDEDELLILETQGATDARANEPQGQRAE